MIRTPIILDCDPGVDDAVAIMLANKITNFDLRGITTVAGNVEIEKTTQNALRVLDLIQAAIPVHQGAGKPVFGEQVTAKQVHGNDGLGGVDLPAPKHEPSELPAWDAIYQEAVVQSGNLEIIAVGPLTNLGLAFLKYRDLTKYLKRIVIMGGSATSGNVTPTAEFNIYADPEAADIVFTSGVPVYMCGLDVTMQAYYTPKDLELIASLGSKPARFFRNVMQSALSFTLSMGQKGVSLHDPLTVLYTADDSIFETQKVAIRVEIKGRLTRGKTVTDLYSDKKMERNAFIVTNVDREALQQRIIDLMKEY